ncbi:uncharacterized protein BP5553_04982 [Venustampulla echinocandica]|uniref:Rhodopsin domain-containing protein n=1 Tax=Venustampulla echinocandica TaxID=2656787 RepID=A0A370TPV5_9HELO|nr:uncharacterized protein BP5553_04982 [Venustampulla echinocandica]RDL37549.1 hypothetical protein BP5553_04982 [Venustampulla echinocandica]
MESTAPVDDHLHKAALGIVAAVAVLETIFLCLRLWSRRVIKRFWLDDYIVIVAWSLNMAMTVTSWLEIKAFYIGYHKYDIPTDFDLEKALKIDYLNQILYIPVLSLVKASVIILFLRIAIVQPRVRLTLKILFAANLAFMIAVLFVEVFQCVPVQALYTMTIKGKCIDKALFYIVSASIAVFTDILILVIPSIIARGLGLPMRQKIAVTILLSLGGFVTIVAIIRLVYFIHVIYFPSHFADPNYSIAYVLSRIETGLAVITACASTLKPLIKKYIPRLLGQSSTSNNQPSGEMTGWAVRSELPQRRRPVAFQIRRILPWGSKEEIPDDDSQREVIRENKPVENADRADEYHEAIRENGGRNGVGANGFV